MSVHSFVGSQLRQPRGWFGRHLMTRMLDRGNRELIEATIAALTLDSGDRYLDVGFGGGRSLAHAMRTAQPVHIYGVDVSPDVVTAGRRRFRKQIAAGRLSVLLGDICNMSLPDQVATKVSTTNTIYFWPDPVVAVQQLYRVLAPGGRLAVAFTGADKMLEYGKVTATGFTYVRPDEVVELIGAAGFTNVQCHAQGGHRTRGDFIVVADRSV